VVLALVRAYHSVFRQVVENAIVVLKDMGGHDDEVRAAMLVEKSSIERERAARPGSS
jgi:hypothetical protein